MSHHSPIFIHHTLLPLAESEQLRFRSYRGWQSKDICGNGELICIEPPGVFWCMPFNMDVLIPIVYTGEFTFYTLLHEPEREWIQFRVRFEGGIMCSIVNESEKLV